MKFENEQEAIQFIKSHLAVPRWVDKARKYHKELKALATGKNFHSVLLEKIEKIESQERADARLKYSKDIRDMYSRVMNTRESVFSAHGGSVRNKMGSTTKKEELINTLGNFKGQKSIKKYLSESFFLLADTDPNGLIFLEYKGDEEIYPTYKSINDIRVYKSNGQLLEVVLFEPVTKINANTKEEYHEWRIVDEEKEYRFKQEGTSFMLIKEYSFDHPFSTVPAVILSDWCKTGSEIRISYLYPIEELAKDYARDKSILTIYKFQNGFPRHWRYERECRECFGTGKDDDSNCCADCGGRGYMRTNDVTDITILSMPREDEPTITPNVEGFVQPDLETWERYNEELIAQEDRIENTMWGTKRIKEGGNETATGRFIDVQPVLTKLNKFTDNVEWVHNTLVHRVEDWLNGGAKDNYEYHITYGRRFIIESQDVLLEKYLKARDEGANNTILDKLLDEYQLAKYMNDPILLDEMNKKRQVEPYVHQSLTEVADIFGAREANKKILFATWWEERVKEGDIITKTTSELRQEFATFEEQNNTVQDTNAGAEPTQ